MKHSVFLPALSLLFCAGPLLGPPVACAQQHASPSQQFRALPPKQDTVRLRATQAFYPLKVSMQPTRTNANRNGLCDILTNGNFDTQPTGNGPTRINNISGGIVTTDQFTIDHFGDKINSQVSGWTSPTVATPDYYATNATGLNSADVTPATGLYATYIPYVSSGTIGSGTNGAVGLGTYEDVTYNANGTIRSRNRRQSEYASTRIPIQSAGQYYASFRVQVSDGGTARTRPTDPVNASNRGVASGFGLQLSTGNLQPIAGSLGGDDFLAGNGSGVLTTAPLDYLSVGTASTSNWTLVAGQFAMPSNNTTNVMTIGLFNSRLTDRNKYPVNGTAFLDTTLTVARTYFLVDDVQLFRIPTAGPPNVSCTGSSVGIGEGCDIPGATYSWSPTTNLSSTNTITTTASPSVTTIYTLTVTLPDNTTAHPSTYSTSVTVGACCVLPARPGSIGGYLDPFIGRIRASIAAVSGATSYNWYLDGSLVTAPVGTGSAHNTLIDIPIPQDGNCHPEYTVSVEAVNSCGASPQNSLYYAAGTGSCRTALGTTAYPNPATGILTLPKGVTNATLLDGQGKAVAQPDATGTLNVQTLPPGLYNLQMQQNGKLINQHIEVKH